jgi:glucose/arabinose dehydrogenase
MKSLFCAAVLAACPIASWSLPMGFTRDVVATGLNVSFLCALKDGRVLVNEKHGAVRVIKDDKLLPTPMLDISSQVNSEVERGLLGIAADPDFASNGFIYLFHNDKDDHAYVTRYKVTGDAADPASAKNLFDLGVHGAPYHHGGDVTFGPDGKLYFTQGNAAGYIGDAKTVSQNKNDLLGSIFRINPDGSIPADNPFYASNTGSARAVWTYGNRNPFNLRFQPGTGLGYFSDVQDNNTDDEIDEAKAGANYGYGGGPSPVAPVLVYGLNGKAQIGGAFYAADQFPAEYRGLFFFGNNGNGNIKTLDPKTGRVGAFDALTGDCAISMDVGARGSLYASARCGDAASVTSGKVYRFSYPDGVSGIGKPSGAPASGGSSVTDVLRWRAVPRGAVRVELLRSGAQSVQLRRADGSLIEAIRAEGPGPVEFRSGLRPGVHLLSWRSGAEKIIAKIAVE